MRNDEYGWDDVEEMSEGEMIEQAFFDMYFYDQEGDLEVWDGFDL